MYVTNTTPTVTMYAADTMTTPINHSYAVGTIHPDIRSGIASATYDIRLEKPVMDVVSELSDHIEELEKRCDALEEKLTE